MDDHLLGYITKLRKNRERKKKKKIRKIKTSYTLKYPFKGQLNL